MALDDDEPFVCAIEGSAAAAGAPDDDGDTLPVGWARITLQIRDANPKWADIDRAEEAAVEIQLAQVPEDKRAEARAFSQVLAEANMAALRSRTPRYLDQEHELFVSPEAMPELFELLGVRVKE